MVYFKTMDILKHISPEWLAIIYKDDTKIMLDEIYNSLSGDEKNITPSICDWFNWCRITPLNDIKIVILGQDPYPTKNWAHGLSFSCLESTPSSLKNIYKCLLHNKLISEAPNHGNLTEWAKQGVLLLNASLTTIIKNPGAHMKIWIKFTESVIKKICQYHYDRNRQLIFMLWGNFAGNFSKIIDGDFHIILKWIHPSPLSQANSEKNKHFIYCNHFSYANKLLLEDGETPINWNITPLIKSEYQTNQQKDQSQNQEKKDIYSDANSILGISPLHHVIFTDGSCNPNNKSKESRAGYALCFVSGPKINTVVYGNIDVSEHYASNIRAEGYAIIRALEIVSNSENWNKVTIVSDCEFWINMIENYMPKWKQTTFLEKTNSDLTRRMWNIYNDVSKKCCIKLVHVRSHNKEGWKSFKPGTFERFCYDKNDYVDKMCSYARLNLKPGEEKSMAE